MLVSYCRQCLHDTQEKVVLAYGARRVDVDVPHDIHQDPMRNGIFPIASNGRDSSKFWQNIYVEGNDAQTKANIISTHADEFVE